MKHRSRSNSRDGHSNTHDMREGSSQKRIHGATINGTRVGSSIWGPSIIDLNVYKKVPILWLFFWWALPDSNKTNKQDPNEGTGTPPDYLAIRVDQKNEGPLFWTKRQKNRDVRHEMSSGGSGSTRTVDAERKCAPSWNQIQTLKACLFCHIYCVHR